MKKFMFLMSFALLVVIGCNKEEVNSTVDQKVEKSSESFYVFNLDDENAVWEFVALDEASSIQNNSDFATTRSNNGNSVHAHGDYHAPNQFATFSFSATQNNGGPKGGAEFLQELPFGTLHLITETHCLIGDGDDAYYTGQITEVIESFFPFDLTGWYFRFGVRDNGQGENAPPDQFSSYLAFGPGPSCGIPSSTFFDVGEESDKIKVNN